MAPPNGDNFEPESASAIVRARQLLAQRSREEIRADVARLVERNRRPFELATPVAQTALSLLDREEGGKCDSWHSAGHPQELLVEARLVTAELNTAARRAIGADVAASWGDLRLTLGQRNVTAHRRDGRRFHAVRWFLLPVLEWLVRSWSELFGPPLTAADAHRRMGEPLSGFPMPGLVLTRWVHRVEVVAVPRELRVPSMIFDARTESIPLDPTLIAQLLRAWCIEVASEVHRRARSPRTEALIHQAEGLDTFEEKPDRRVAAAPLQTSVQQVCERVGERFEKLLAPVRHRPSPLRLAFGAATPRITEEDVEAIWQVVDRLEQARSPAADALRNVRRSVPLPAGELPWRHGQMLADEALAALKVERDAFVDVEGVLAKLGVPVDRLTLNDTTVRGVVVGYPARAPLVLVNRGCSRNRKRPSRRFTLAHELCHVLFDQGSNRSLGVVDGEWAPYGIEQRANAFAAMFLMPPELVSRVANELGTNFTIGRLAARMGTSPTATREHVRNLRTIGALDLSVSLPDEVETAQADADAPDYRAA